MLWQSGHGLLRWLSRHVKVTLCLFEEPKRMSESGTLHSMFDQKYTEFAADLKETFPELEEALTLSLTLSTDERVAKYQKEVGLKHAKPLGDGDLPCPGPVLPGVTITESLWATVSEGTKKAVYDYLSILDLCTVFDSKEGLNKEWVEEAMRNWQERLEKTMGKVDMDGLAEKLKSLFSGDGSGLPKIPEKFLKGKLAKLAEDMVREFKPEDFGLDAKDLEALEKNPTKAFEIMITASTSNPAKMQAAMARVAKRLQEKVARGELRPQEIAAEAEEMINEFRSHPAFVEIMETFRSAFSFEDPELARAAGRDGDARRAIVRDRLRKKLEAKRGGKK